jgi:hypothetical protein|tara:strand:- start:5125 stop:5334 length:210 start_codon:yes stop_codon:yes gene_type:complete
MMGVGKAMVFGFFAMFPGMILSLIAWVLVGQPENWASWMSIPCYGPFFGCIALGVWLGMRSDEEVELET